MSKKMMPVSLTEPLIIILSPAFYWFREAVLPAKTAAQARKLAPAFFDTILPEGDYDFVAIMHNEAFWLFAYDPDMISEALHDAGIKPAQVRGIFFAQTEFSQMTQPLTINEETVLTVNEGVVSAVSSRYVAAQESADAYCNQHARSRHKIPISLYRSGMLDAKQVNRLTLIAILFLGLYLGNYLQLRAQFKQQLVKANAIAELYKLPATSFQRESLTRSLEDRQARQLAWRKVFKSLDQLRLEDGEAMEVLAMDARKGQLTFSLADPKRAEALKRDLQRFVRVTADKVKDKKLYVSVAYE